ncbi:MAG: hypothetical protein HQL29_03425 [Candidatus Omnitrophica bacterium]|nr:hypothetical protein [Candidatus Omnitrophota bacterium]
MEGIMIVVMTVVVVVMLFGLLGKVACNCKKTEDIEEKLKDTTKTTIK